MFAPTAHILLCLLLTFQLALQPVFATANSSEHQRLETFYTNTEVNVGGAFNATSGRGFVMERATIDAASVALDASGDTEASLRNQQRLESLIHLMNNLDQLPDQAVNSLRAKAEELGKLIDEGRFESAGEIIGEFNATAAGISTVVVTLPAAVTSSDNFFRKIAPKSGVCSFHRSTQVLTSGGYSPIKDLKAGMSVWSKNDWTGQLAWKSILAQYSNPCEETVHVTMHDVETGETQTIVSNKIHPFFVQTPQSENLLHWAATGTDRVVPPPSEGHSYHATTLSACGLTMQLK